MSKVKTSLIKLEAKTNNGKPRCQVILLDGDQCLNQQNTSDITQPVCSYHLCLFSKKKIKSPSRLRKAKPKHNIYGEYSDDEEDNLLGKRELVVEYK